MIWKIPNINVRDYPKVYSSVNEILNGAFKLLGYSSELDKQWETGPFQVSGNSALYSVKGAILLPS